MKPRSGRRTKDEEPEYLKIPDYLLRIEPPPPYYPPWLWWIRMICLLALQTTHPAIAQHVLRLKLHVSLRKVWVTFYA